MISHKRLIAVGSMLDNGLSMEKIARLLKLKMSTIERYARHIFNDSGKGGAKKEPKHSAPKILLFDIETLPMEVYVWGLYKQKIPMDNIIKDWSIVSWSAKWLFSPHIYSGVVSPTEAMERNDKSIMLGIFNLFESANIIVGHNCNRFDIRKLNARWIVNGYPPPSPYKVVDTLKVSQKRFAFSSHKLDYLVNLLCDTNKLKTEYSLWKRCCNGDDKALRYMEKYNKRDVRILEDLYVELIPWLGILPSYGLYGDCKENMCPHCGGSDLDFNITPYYTTAGRFKAFRCTTCMSIGRSRISDLTKEDRESLLLSI